MKRVAVGLIVGLILGGLVGFRLAPRTDTSVYEGTIDLLLEELETTNGLLEDVRVQVTELEVELEEKENELTQLRNEIDSQSDTDEIGVIENIGPELVWIYKMVYQLQNYDLDALEDAQANLYIIDYSKEGDEESRFTKYEVQRLQNMTWKGRVLSYLSIGEAEDYRWYWDEDWTYDEPSWLGDTNPEWEGNYKVKYWDENWRAIIYEYIDKIMESGFSGVYLDIIDAYEYWGPDGDSGLDRATAEQEMVDFVVAISEYAKAKDADFLIYPQNGEALGVHSEYLEAVDGIGREDVWYNDDDLQTDTNITLSYLKMFSDAGKQVIVIDYPTEEALILDFCEKAKALGYIPYPGGRELDDIRECPEREE